MKKVFFAFVAVSVVILSACNNAPKTEGDASAADTTIVTTETTVVTDTTGVVSTTTTDTTVTK